jgi:oligopeptide transport system ATP-binding protein
MAAKSDIKPDGTTKADDSVLKVEELKKHFPVKGHGLWPWSPKAQVRAVDGIDLDIQPNEMFGLAGESGCGKSTVGRLILGLIRATSGRVKFWGQDIEELSHSQLRAMRPNMQMVFQDPYTSLNPRRTVGDIVSDPLVVHTNVNGEKRRQKVMEMLDRVGLAPDHYYRYPHEFSGGQRQRIAIARAMILEPDFLVLDEPTSALDVSVQAVIVTLIQRLQSEMNLSCLFITHDLNLLRFLCDRLAVMYLGKIAELAGKEEVFSDPLHPYTRALIAATPQPNPGGGRQKVYLAGEVPSNLAPPPGCSFHTRCGEKIGSICETQDPELVQVQGRLVRCHLYG